MDGVLLIDKPSGPTSHDVVARMRSVTGERSIGHTGTLDPMATGLLPLVLGKATRLSAYLTGGDKTYDATIRLGFFTDTDDALGTRLDSAPGQPPVPPFPDEATVVAALDRFRGTFDQMPPNHSAKKVGGKKAYDMARMDTPLALEAVSVTVSALDCTGVEGDIVHLTVTATAGLLCTRPGEGPRSDIGLWRASGGAATDAVRHLRRVARHRTGRGRTAWPRGREPSALARRCAQRFVVGDGNAARPQANTSR